MNAKNLGFFKRWTAAVLVVGAVMSVRTSWAAGTPAPDQSAGWQTATAITMAAGAATQLLVPRIFYSDPEVTVGWKARWHISALAPVMSLAALTLLNNYLIVPTIGAFRPGCDATNTAAPGCTTYGMPSSYALGSFSSFGNGMGVFLIDTVKWSGGRFHAGSFVGNVGVPLVLSVFTGVGRGVGHYESAAQIAVGGAVGFGLGLLTGIGYALMQRPECGYTGALYCW